MKKHGVRIDCAACRFMGNQGSRSFDVIVPIADDETGMHGDARLHCSVSPHAHVVELTEWSRAEVAAMLTGSGLDRRLSNVLDYVAEKKLCGNRSLCPKEVVEVVEKNGSA